ncbi:MAG TPA: hypothetical protein K8V56_16660 [Sporosarcina psychrophila]|uniref:Uncharacterized protein n=1 Tax=Sporosarcina psychrophila TaxID=1476 RepID=A0A921G0X0_SPOPS|nr:hypothetical protein [Sporosarcina psychrophila]
MPNNKDKNPNKDRNKKQIPSDMREEFGSTFDIDKLNDQKNDPKKQKEQRANRFDNNTR